MRMSYEKLSRKGLTFSRLTGVNIKEFEEICQRVKPLWQKDVEEKKQCAGRPAILRSIEDKVLALLIYYCTYITQEFIGYLFNLDRANVCRLLKNLSHLWPRD